MMDDPRPAMVEALTFDDVLLEPGYSEVLPAQVEVRTRLTREIELGIPLVSAAMARRYPAPTRTSASDTSIQSYRAALAISVKFRTLGFSPSARPPATSVMATCGKSRCTRRATASAGSTASSQPRTMWKSG